TICRTSSRKSAPSFTNRLQRPAHKLARNPGQKLVHDPALNKAQVQALAVEVMATSSTRSSKSWTKTRRNRQTICRLGAKPTFRSRRLNPKTRSSQGSKLSQQRL